MLKKWKVSFLVCFKSKHVMGGKEIGETLKKKIISVPSFTNLDVVTVSVLAYLFPHLCFFFFFFLCLYSFLKKRKGKNHTIYIVLYPVFLF